MQKIKDFFKKVIGWITPVIDFIVKWWKKFIWLVAQEEFVFSFPFAVFSVVVLCTHSFFMIIALIIWLVACVVNFIEN
jgi:hypothetical protein